MPPDSGNQPPFTSFVSGSWEAVTNRVVVRENPGRTAEVAARWCPATAAVAQRAMESANAAFPAWSAVPISARIDHLAHFLDAVAANRERFATAIMLENGKPLRDADSEVSAGLRDASQALADAQHDGVVQRVSSDGATVRSELILEPSGVHLLITPWNFPLATILRKLVPALAYGNTVVVKPSELTPGCAKLLFELLEQSDFPPGTASLVYGLGAEVGPELIHHPALRGISFTGSTATGRALACATAARDVRLQLEMGGKNPLVVLADADVDAAVDAALTGGFSCAGQWCTGTGRVIVDQAVHDTFVNRLSDRAQSLRVGPGDDPATQIGPVISADRVQSAKAIVTTSVAAGARLRCGGDTIDGGHFFRPTVLDGVEESMPAFLDELFVPVLPVTVARDAEDAVRLANTGCYGLSASVFSADVARAESIARRLEAGIVHVNLHTAYREPTLPVAGWRDSGHGLPECGRFAKDFYTRPRALYIRNA